MNTEVGARKGRVDDVFAGTANARFNLGADADIASGELRYSEVGEAKNGTLGGCRGPAGVEVAGKKELGSFMRSLSMRAQRNDTCPLTVLTRRGEITQLRQCGGALCMLVSQLVTQKYENV